MLERAAVRLLPAVPNSVLDLAAIVHVGQFDVTTVQSHVRCLTLATVLEASRQWVCRWSPFDSASGIEGESLP